jgi:hypothetical protein
MVRQRPVSRQEGHKVAEHKPDLFAGEKYLSIETYRKSGTPVSTPVWFAADNRHPATLYVYSLANAGKVKRIRNNPSVRVAPCTMRGALRGEWAPAQARIVDSGEATRGHALLNKKYWMKPIGDFFSRLRGRTQVIIAIRLST